MFKKRLQSQSSHSRAAMLAQQVQPIQPNSKGLKKNGAPVSLAEFLRDLETTRGAGGINPHNLAINRSLANYVYTYFNVVLSQVDTAIGTALRAYWNALTGGHEYLIKSAKNLTELEQEFESVPNQSKAEEILSGANASLVVVFRGTNPNQAKKILDNMTLGGEASAGVNLPSPGEAAAQAQTGLNIKETEHGRIEEWSTQDGGLTGFATDGVMLVALVNRDSVATTSLTFGEQGATGYARQPLAEVAIYEMGRQSLSSDEVKLLDAAKKSFNLEHGIQDKTHAKPQALANIDPSNPYMD